MVEEAERTDLPMHFPPQKDVGRRAEVAGQRQILMHDLDADVARIDRVVETHFLICETHQALARPEYTRDDLAEGRLARAVTAHQADNLARRDREADMAESLNRAIRFPYANEIEQAHRATTAAAVGILRAWPPSGDGSRATFISQLSALARPITGQLSLFGRLPSACRPRTGLPQQSDIAFFASNRAHWLANS
jgi:hypothetical protein